MSLKDPRWDFPDFHPNSTKTLGLVASLCVLAGCGKPADPVPQAGAQREPTIASVAPVTEISPPQVASWAKIDDPNADGWDSEHRAELAHQQLDLIGAALTGGAILSAETIANAEVTTNGLRPAETDSVFEEGLTSVGRGRDGGGEIQQGLEAFARAVRNATPGGSPTSPTPAGSISPTTGAL